MFLPSSRSLFFKQPPLFGARGKSALERCRMIGERWITLSAAGGGVSRRVSGGGRGKVRRERGRLGWERGECDATTWFSHWTLQLVPILCKKNNTRVGITSTYIIRHVLSVKDLKEFETTKSTSINAI